MNKIDMLHKDYPTGTRWWVPKFYHLDYEQSGLEPINGFLPATVVNHTVGAGLRRNADAGIIIRFGDGYTMEIVDSYYLPEKRVEV